MKYTTQYEEQKIIICPEIKNELIKRSISFWEAEIFTRNNINTVSYRFAVTAATTEKQFEQLLNIIAPLNWKSLDNVNGAFGDSYRNKKDKIKKFFDQLIKQINLDPNSYSALECNIGLNKNEYVNFDVKEESIEKNTNQYFQNGKSKTTFRIDIHIHKGLNHNHLAVIF